MQRRRAASPTLPMARMDIDHTWYTTVYMPAEAVATPFTTLHYYNSTVRHHKAQKHTHATPKQSHTDAAVHSACRKGQATPSYDLQPAAAHGVGSSQQATKKRINQPHDEEEVGRICGGTTRKTQLYAQATTRGRRRRASTMFARLSLASLPTEACCWGQSWLPEHTPWPSPASGGKRASHVTPPLFMIPTNRQIATAQTHTTSAPSPKTPATVLFAANLCRRQNQNRISGEV